MLYRHTSDHKNSATQSLSALRADQRRISSSEQRDVTERNEKRITVSIWGITTPSIHNSVSPRTTSLSRRSSTSGREKRASHQNDQELLNQPFITRYGRQYLRDLTLSYPLPCDLLEINRQILRTILLCQVFKGPFCSPSFERKPPIRVLEVACGTGFWSEMCHRHFSQHGHSSISFTGIDIAFTGNLDQYSKYSSMNWRFVQHDLRRVPLPFNDGEFCAVMIKDLSLVIPTTDLQQALMDEYIRILKPGGTIEFWDGDHSLRMLLPPTNSSTNDCNDNFSDTVESPKIPRGFYEIPTGSYTLAQQLLFTAPKNSYLNDYNTWISKILSARKLASMPCTAMLSTLCQESEYLQEIDCRRLAIPLSGVWWETVIDSQSKYDLKGKKNSSDQSSLIQSHAAIRNIALKSFTQLIESLEPLLQEASGKGQEEWDLWMDNIMRDLLKDNGTSSGECLEVGACWAKKKLTTLS